MRREDGNFFAHFFSARSSEDIGGSREVLTTASAQPHVLREKMKEMELTHGETVTVNMSPVRLEAAYGKMYLYFCPMEDLEVLETITAGDGGDIPPNVTVEGLTIPAEHNSGLYTLKNVRLSSNGTMQVIANSDTIWEKL